MGCCFTKKTSTKKTPFNPNDSNSPIYVEDPGFNLQEQPRQTKEQRNIIERKRNDFIDNFFSKDTGLNGMEKSNTIFITNLNKKMFITKDIILVEDDFILKVNLNDANSYYNNYWMFLDADVNDMISREIYIDDIKSK